jgi:hypothetical protein
MQALVRKAMDTAGDQIPELGFTQVDADTTCIEDFIEQHTDHPYARQPPTEQRAPRMSATPRFHYSSTILVLAMTKVSFCFPRELVEEYHELLSSNGARAFAASLVGISYSKPCFFPA